MLLNIIHTSFLIHSKMFSMYQCQSFVFGSRKMAERKQKTKENVDKASLFANLVIVWSFTALSSV